MEPFQYIAERLSSEARELLRDMVTLHLAATGDRTFQESRSWQMGTTLIFHGDGVRTDLRKVDGGALEDLVQYRLLQRSYSRNGTATYRIGSDGVAFHQYLLDQEGAAIDQVEAEVARLVAGDEFARKHSAAADHLNQAMELVWSRRTDDQAVSEVGGHLRHALMDITGDVVGEDGKNPEFPLKRLRPWLEGQDLGERERHVVEHLVELADAVLDLDQRLTHVRDEKGKSRPGVTWDELRRAAFTTAFVCHELSRITR